MATQRKEQRPPGKTAVIYARYSSAAQRDVSIEQQVNECRRFAEREGLTVTRIYDDHAMTGTNDNRPAFRQMIADSANGWFDYVIVYTLDRFARNQYDSVFNKKTLRDNGVRVLSAMENLRDDPTGHLMESVLEGFAQYFSEELKQKVVRGMRSNAEKAMVIGPCPFGLKKGDDGKYAIVEEEAKILREIYRRAAGGEPFADIFRDLNERGVKTKKGREWDRSSFNQLLHNPKYIGIYSYGDIIIENGIPAILDREIFDKVQLRCKAKEYPRKNPQRRRRENGTYLLTGKLFCGECKSAMIGASAHGHGGWYFYYTCKTHMDHKDQCRKKSVKRDEIELWIATQLQQVFRDPDVVNAWIEDALAYKNREIQTDEISLLQDQLKARTQEKENTLKAIRMGVVTDSVLAMLKEIEADESSLRARLSLAEERKATAVDPKELKGLIRMLTDGDVNDKSFQERLFDSFLVKAYVYDDRLVLVVNPTVNGTDEITIPFDIDTVAGTAERLDSFEVADSAEGSCKLPKGVLGETPEDQGFRGFSYGTFSDRFRTDVSFSK